MPVILDEVPGKWNPAHPARIGPELRAAAGPAERALQRGPLQSADPRCETSKRSQLGGCSSRGSISGLNLLDYARIWRSSRLNLRDYARIWRSSRSLPCPRNFEIWGVSNLEIFRKSTWGGVSPRRTQISPKFLSNSRPPKFRKKNRETLV